MANKTKYVSELAIAFLQAYFLVYSKVYIETTEVTFPQIPLSEKEYNLSTSSFLPLLKLPWDC